MSNVEKVKGTMLIDQVRMIRGNKDKDWCNYLTSEDWAIVKGMVMPASWYPVETYKRCGRAVFQVLAGGNTDIVRLRGKMRGKELFETTYKHLLMERYPMNALSSFVNLYGQLFMPNPLGFKKMTDKHAHVSYEYEDKNDPGNLPFCYQLMGHFDSLIEMTGGADVKIEFAKKMWEGASETVFDIQWQ